MHDFAEWERIAAVERALIIHTRSNGTVSFTVHNQRLVWLLLSDIVRTFGAANRVTRSVKVLAKREKWHERKR